MILSVPPIIPPRGRTASEATPLVKAAMPPAKHIIKAISGDKNMYVAPLEITPLAVAIARAHVKGPPEA